MPMDDDEREVLHRLVKKRIRFFIFAGILGMLGSIIFLVLLYYVSVMGLSFLFKKPPAWIGWAVIGFYAFILIIFPFTERTHKGEDELELPEEYAYDLAALRTLRARSETVPLTGFVMFVLRLFYLGFRQIGGAFRLLRTPPDIIEGVIDPLLAGDVPPWDLADANGLTDRELARLLGCLDAVVTMRPRPVKLALKEKWRNPLLGLETASSEEDSPFV